MKKVLAIIFSAILLVSCLSLTAFAGEKLFGYEGDWEIDFDTIYEPVEASISEDFQTLYINGESYSGFDASLLDITYYKIDLYDGSDNYLPSRQLKFNYTDNQKENIKFIFVKCNGSENIFYVEIVQNNGATFKGSFLKDSDFDKYERFIQGEGYFTVDFVYPSDNTFSPAEEFLYGEEITLKGSRLDYLQSFGVKFTSNDGSFEISDRGALLIGQDEYYFVDCNENDNAELGFGNQLSYDYNSTFLAHKITDADTIEQLNQRYADYDEYYAQEYEDSDYEILYDEERSYTVAIVLLVFYFCLIPVVIFVIFLIKAIKSTGSYRVVYLTTAVLSILVIAVIAILLALFRGA